MKNIIYLIFLVMLSGCNTESEKRVFTDPQEGLQLDFFLDQNQRPVIRLSSRNQVLLDSSYLGLIRSDGDFSKAMKILTASEAVRLEEGYRMHHGKQKQIEYSANEYTVKLENAGKQRMDIIFRLSEDGLALRYHFPENAPEPVQVLEERTAWRFPEGSRAWLQPMSKAKSGWKETNPSYEEHYLMDIPVSTPSPIGEGWVYPALFRVNDQWMLFSEADVHAQSCGTRLQYDSASGCMHVRFPQKEEIFPGGELLPTCTGSWSSPWRIIAAGSLGSVVESSLGTDLAAPAIEMNTDFVKGGLASWSWVLLKDDFTNYETSKAFIDYAAAMNWPYCLIDADWDWKIGYERMAELVDYAATKKVGVLLWYNSSGSWNSTTYTPKSKLLTHEDRVSEFAKLREMGVKGCKIDFFGGDGQSMIAYYHDILKDAAAHELLVNFHGATLPRGWHRTYPNLMTMESIKGQEFITFFQENADLQPSHCAMIPFARNVFDPMDFTPMVLDSIPNIARRTKAAFELALPVLFTSGIQHMAEIPEGMAKMPDFIVHYLREIPVDWDETRFMDGFPGKYVVMARRKGEVWYVVGINGEKTPGKLDLDLSFMGEKAAFLITDGTDSLFDKKDLDLSTMKKLSIELQPFGGFVLRSYQNVTGD
ncbi:MAG: glycoside hydrolase family 97 catalytic domain-containing protein [Bacteroidia bacterium]